MAATIPFFLAIVFDQPTAVVWGTVCPPVSLFRLFGLLRVGLLALHARDPGRKIPAVGYRLSVHAHIRGVLQADRGPAVRGGRREGHVADGKASHVPEVEPVSRQAFGESS